MSCQTVFPKICGYYLWASIITLGASTSLCSLPKHSKIETVAPKEEEEGGGGGEFGT